MDPLDFLEPEELLQFFSCNKTEMSCFESPHTFLNQLRDHRLIPEDRYKKLIRMKSKENLKKSIYELLDWFEKNHSQHIKVFWRCLFKETITSQYPTLKQMRLSLMDGSFRCDIQLPEKMEEESSEGKEEASDCDEEEEIQPSCAKRRKKQSKSVCTDEEEQAVSSTQTTPGQKKRTKKISFSSPLKKGEKGDIWTWPIYKSQLPVTCGLEEGTLNRGRLAKGEKCILVDKKWFTPSQFERHGGRGNCKNWKISIRCQDVPLGKLIQDGHLESGSYRARQKKAKKLLFLSDDSNTVSEGDEEDEDQNEKETEEEEDDEQPSTSRGAVASGDEDEEEQTKQQPSIGTDMNKNVFNVTCEGKAGTLHVKRFASGDRGKSIRTETSWMTPIDFVKSASCQTDLSWRKDITWEGKPLSVLIEAGDLRIHSLLCKCSLCKPGYEDIENQKNDDECYICKIGVDEELVVCDQCPRSFHQKCHLPNVDDAILGDDKPWMCTFCIFRTTREWMFQEERERDAAMAQQISQHLLGCQYLLLSLLSADEDQTFTSNPSIYLKDYTSVIKTPMWLEKISDKLQNKVYKTVGEFVCDVQLIFTNCASFNRDNDEFLTMGNRLKDLFDKELTHVFNIREETEPH